MFISVFLKDNIFSDISHSGLNGIDYKNCKRILILDVEKILPAFRKISNVAKKLKDANNNNTLHFCSTYNPKHFSGINKLGITTPRRDKEIASCPFYRGGLDPYKKMEY